MGLAHHNFEVYYFTSNATKTLPLDHVHTIHSFSSIWDQNNKILKIIYYFKGLFRSLRCSKKKKIKILHFHVFHINWLFLFSIVICKILRFKVVVTIHDIATLAGKSLPAFFHKKLIYSIDEIIVHNKSSLREITDLLPKRTYNLIPHGNYLPFVKKVRPQEFTTDFRILFFGQIKKVKGLDILLEALSILKERNIKCKLTIAGKIWKDRFERYQSIIDERKLGELVVTDLNYIPDHAIWDYFNAANLVILPYRKIYQSGVLLMAMSYGRVVLTSDLPAFKEILVANHNGFLFKCGDAASLANKIKEINLRRSILPKIEDQAYEDVSGKFDWKVIGAMTEKVYSKISFPSL